MNDHHWYYRRHEPAQAFCRQPGGGGGPRSRKPVFRCLSSFRMVFRIAFQNSWLMYCRIFAKKIVCLSCMHFYRNHFVVYHYDRERYRRTYQMSDCSFSLLLELSRTARAGKRELACSCAARGSDGGRGCLGGDAGREARARVGLAGPADQARRRQKSPPGKESSTSEAGTCFLMHHCCKSRQQLLITSRTHAFLFRHQDSKKHFSAKVFFS